MIYNWQPYQPWLQKNPSYLKYLEEQLRWINLDFQFPALLSKEKIAYLEKEKEYFSAEIHKVKWAIKTREIMQWK